MGFKKLEERLKLYIANELIALNSTVKSLAIETRRTLELALEQNYINTRLLEQSKKTKSQKPKGNKNLDDKLDASVGTLHLSPRSRNCLNNDNIKTIRELVTQTKSELLKTPNLGIISLHEIQNELKELGLTLGMKV